MVQARLIGFRVNDPSLITEAFGVLNEYVEPYTQHQGFGIAASADNSVLITSVPIRSNQGFMDVASRIRTPTGLVQLAGKEGGRQGPFRWNQFAASVVGGAANFEELKKSRELFLAEMPEFLQRNLAGASENEALFFAVIAQAFKTHLLDFMKPAMPQMADCIRRVVGQTKADSRCIMLAAGNEALCFSQKKPMGLLQFHGIDEEKALACSNNLMDTPIDRERLRRFRGVFVFAWLDSPIMPPKEKSANLEVRSFVEDTIIYLQQDMQWRTL